MLHSTRSLVSLVASGLALSACTETAPPYPTEVSGAYIFVIDSKLETELRGQQASMESRTEIAYRNERSGSTLEVTADHLKAESSVNGEVRAASEMSARGGRVLTPEGMRDQNLEDVPEAVQATLRESFGVPLAEIELDRDGTELEFKSLAGDAAQPLIRAGLVENARFFHAPFPGDDTWTAERRFETGSGNKASGALTYRKKSEQGERVVVEVSGSMTGSGVQWGQRMNNVRYEVSGTQVYDVALREWVAGNLEVDVSYDLWSAHAPVGSTKGTLVITLEPNTAIDEPAPAEAGSEALAPDELAPVAAREPDPGQ